jgi:acyl-CoA thioester hydrolase
MGEVGVHRHGLRVYWEDTDAAGIVYYANYLKFAERGRTELLRSLGIEQEGLRRTTGLAFAVRRCVVDYLRPARLDDSLAVETRVTALRGASVDLHQAIQRDGVALVEISVTVACLGSDGRPARLPPALRHALAAFAAQGT